ncbi:hypothetical protein [Bacteroides stercoris]|jgi:hypothetical protein|uniref:hypothetical protein n=1 Tax=Bacteroides stercoris TaxID=46506 RepID=UPI00189F852B|nr:hypothetical protein [Bacteroides stercoris]DAQ15230.1 MAG TPA: hypothetical protein [Caudoviricetes sp.]
MEKNDVASFFYYMWNCWCEQECETAFARSGCGWRHLWNKWCQYSSKHQGFGTAEEFFANLSEDNQDLLVKRALELYDRRKTR